MGGVWNKEDLYFESEVSDDVVEKFIEEKIICFFD